MTLSADDSCLPVVPMFHANSWGLAFSCPMRGAKMVMPGAKLDGASVYELLETEKVDVHRRRADRLADAAAISAARSGKKLSTLKLVVIGGSACPPEHDPRLRATITASKCATPGA